MKSRVSVFLTIFIIYCVLLVSFKGVSKIGQKEIFEMFFIGAILGTVLTLLFQPTMKIIGNILKK